MQISDAFDGATTRAPPTSYTPPPIHSTLVTMVPNRFRHPLSRLRSASCLDSDKLPPCCAHALPSVKSPHKFIKDENLFFHLKRRPVHLRQTLESTCLCVRGGVGGWGLGWGIDV